MAQFDIAAISLLQLLGLLEESGDVSWGWLGDPHQHALNLIPSRRRHFGRLLRALQGAPSLDAAYEPLGAGEDLVWEPLALGPVQVGFAWSVVPDDAPPADDADPDEPRRKLRLAIAARANPQVGDPPLTLAVVAHLADVTSHAGGGGDLASALGTLAFKGSFPVPDFLQSAAIEGAYAPNQPLDLALSVQDRSGSAGGADTRVLALDSGELGWDAARLAAFVLQAFVAPRAAADAPTKGFFSRAQNHLFPLLGGGAGGAIAPFPVFQPMQAAPDLDAWKDSVFTQGGALTFLWHLRALLTGNESPDFIKASYHLPLHGAPLLPDAAEAPDPAAFTSQTPPSQLTEPGAWLGIVDQGGCRVVLELRLQPNGPLAELPLAAVVNDTLVRPPVPAGELAKLAGTSFSLPIGGGRSITGAKEQSAWRITLFDEVVDGVDALGGAYRFQVVLGDEVAFAVDTPLSGPVTVPGPGNQPATVQPEAVVARLVDLLVGAIPDASHPLVPLVQDLADYVTSALEGQPPTVGALLGTATTLLGASGLGEFPIGDALTVKLTGDGDLALRGEFGPLDFGAQGEADFADGKKMAVRIGKVIAEVALDLRHAAVAPVKTFSVNIVDFRVALPGGMADGLLASLLPDLKEAPGFTLGMTWTPDGPTFAGGGRIPVQRTLGPLTVNTLAVDVDAARTRVGIDLSFQLSVVTVSAHELGVEFEYDGTVTPFLHGLALSCNTGGIVLAGMFGAVEREDGTTDYVGGAVVKVMDLFELSAVGGYSQIKRPGQAKADEPSLFLFASLVAPLGGPPWMFITGIAGGFGYNRALPPAGQLTEHPFLKVMRGDIDLGDSSTAALAALSAQFAPELGQYWLAAGLQFTSFGFINGKAVVVVGLGHEFSLSVLAMAAFGIEPIAYFELGIEATANEREFRLLAGVSPNSYLIHPDIFSLRGQFGLLVRHSGPGAGDFVFTIGGYHPAFTPPEYYPVIERVGCKAVVYGFVRLSVEAFFACTPQALMGGAKVSLAAEFEGIGAGLDVYVDALMKWDPFFIQATMGVCLWFEFFGRHEIGVDLAIHTPPFGGTATIDLALVSFDVDFGKSLSHGSDPTLAEFLTGQLGVSATPKAKGKVQHLRFNDGTGAGLFRVDVTAGRPADAPAWDSDAQEGVVDPIRVNAEFEFTVKSRLPIAELQLGKYVPPGSAIAGGVDLPLCRLDGMGSRLAVTGAGVAQAQTRRLVEFFPKATFGDEPLPEAQTTDTSARAQIGAMATNEAVVPLTEGIRFRYEPTFAPASVDALTGGLVEYSLGDERYPLPLGVHVGVPPVVIEVPRTPLAFDFDKLKVALTPSVGRVGRGALALDAASERRNRPLHVATTRADVQRFPAAARARGFTVAKPPAGAVVIAAPASPARRAELFGVHLRMVAPHAPVSLRRQRLDGVSRARNAARLALTPPDGVRERHVSRLTVAPGEARQVTLDGGRTRGGRLALAGMQWVRAIVQSGSGAFLGDQYLPAGTRTLALPRRARRVTLVGEGTDAPVAPVPTLAAVVLPRTTAATSLPNAVATEAVGIERDSVLMALGRHTFAGHGCVLESLAATGLAARPLDHAPGFAVLRATRRARVHFPAVPKGAAWTLVLTLAPTTPAARSAVEQVRWLSEHATLSGLMTVVSPDRTALLMTAAAAAAWTLDVDLGNEWRLAGVALAGQPTRELYDAFRAATDWDLVDDRLPQTTDKTPTQVTVEIDYE